MDSDQPTCETFLFADIAGYTALTEAHGDADAAELAVAFSRELSAIARDRDGEVVKTIGDAVMVRHSDPAHAVELGLTAAHDVIAGHGFPAVRVGMHRGPAVSHDGDWFGATVNLAARVAGLAAGGEVLVTAACSWRKARRREASSTAEATTASARSSAPAASPATRTPTYSPETEAMASMARRPVVR